MRFSKPAVLILISFLWLTSFVSAETETEDKTSIEELKKMTRTYSKTPYMHVKFKQTQLMELLGETNNSKGNLYYSNKKLRVELTGDQKTVTLFTPGVITSISYDENNKPTQVLKSKPYPHPLLSLMFGEENTWNDFEITETMKNNKTVLEVQVSPKDPSKLAGIDRIEISLNKKKSQIQKIIYWDEVGNKTTNEFVSQRPSDKVDGTKFVLVPPEGVEVRNL